MGNRFSFRRSAAGALTLSAMVAVALAAGPWSANAGSAQCGPCDAMLPMPVNPSSPTCPACPSPPCYQTDPQASRCFDKDPNDFPTNSGNPPPKFFADFLFITGLPPADDYLLTTNNPSLTGTLIVAMNNNCPLSTTAASQAPCVQVAPFTGTIAAPPTGSSCRVKIMTLSFASHGGALANCQITFCVTNSTNFSSIGITNAGSGICALAGPIPPNNSTALNFTSCRYSP